MSSRLLTASSVLFLTSLLSAQLPGPGLSWTGTTASVRSFLPSCTDFPVTAVVNEAVEVRVWGDQQAPFILLAGPSARQCTPIPGLGNALMLDAPVILIAAGVLTQTSPCLSCPPGYEGIPMVVPASFPSGGAISFQGVSFGARNPAFTAAITATVR
jgi:hypothetical protein